VASIVYLDTHVVAWLYAGLVERFPPAVLQRLKDSEVRISPLVTLELEYLHETGRLTVRGAQVVGELALQIGLVICDLPFQAVVEQALHQRWTRDPFDRILVAQAAATGRELITRDRVIRDHCDLAVWE
jgi:PIN domain nuclease of toxin-antitoxin system